MKFNQMLTKRSYLRETIVNSLIFIVIGPIHELIHAITTLILGGQVYSIEFLPNHSGNLTTMVQLNSSLDYFIVALAPGLILGILGVLITKTYFIKLKSQLKKSNNITPEIYSNVFKLAIGLIALLPLAYGLMNFLGSSLNSESLYSGDYTLAANSLGNTLKNTNFYSLYSLFPESTQILAISLLTTLFSILFYMVINPTYNSSKVIFFKAIRNISKFILKTYRNL